MHEVLPLRRIAVIEVFNFEGRQFRRTFPRPFRIDKRARGIAGNTIARLEMPFVDLQ